MLLADALVYCCAAATTLIVLLVVDYLRECGYFTRRCSVSGQLVPITGAAGGLGRAMALEFACRGAVLVLWDMRSDALAEAVDWLVARGVCAERDQRSLCS